MARGTAHVFFLVLSSATAVCLAGVQEEVQGTPPPPNWAEFIEQIPPLGRRLRVASPCVGIHGCGHALAAMNVPTDSTNVYDLEAGYTAVLYNQLREMGMEGITLHLGKSIGNLLNVALRDLERPVDFLVCGPPCPPWAGQGRKAGMGDVRAKVFLRIVVWLVFFIKSCGLIGVVLENVVGITQQSGGREAFSSLVLRTLDRFCPEFHFRVDTLALTSYCLAQTRVRVFLRGMRRAIVPLCPLAPQPQFCFDVCVFLKPKITGTLLIPPILMLICSQPPEKGFGQAPSQHEAEYCGEGFHRLRIGSGFVLAECGPV
jgi:site-specific DNA-cytosine methylase